MQTLADLTANFSLEDHLTFDEPHPGLLRARVATAACTAELYLHGAHLTAWQPAGHAPALWLSDRSAFAPDKAIRGGVPVIFPWFGPRSIGDRTDGPQHGFARTTTWELAFAALAGAGGSAEDADLHLTFTLAPDATSHALGYDHFRLAYTLILGRELRLRLAIANDSAAPLTCEAALHTYLHVGDVRRITLDGLAHTGYLDKTDSFARKTQPEGPLQLTAQTDRMYLNTAAAVTLHDPALTRKLTVAKSGSDTTVVWNPWHDGVAKIADMPPDAWPHFVCIEAAAANENRITLAPGAAHQLEQHITVETTD